MASPRAAPIRILAIALAVILISACASSGSAPRPSPIATLSPSPVSAEFRFEIVPAEDPAAVRAAIPGERICFLSPFSPAELGTGPIAVTATARGAAVDAILQPTVAAPVAEIWVTPDPSTVETTATVDFTATRGSITKTVVRSVPVFPMVDERAADAEPHFTWWRSWLVANHPELGITDGTTWTPRFVSTLLVVSHYAYDSEEWELNILWHNMIPPYDWREVQLRHRGTEVAPSLAFRQDSVRNGTEPHAVQPPDEPVR